jgi:hypothetical protein
MRKTHTPGILAASDPCNENSTNRRPRIPSKIYLSNNRTRRTGACKKAWPHMANAKDAAYTRRDA